MKTKCLLFFVCISSCFISKKSFGQFGLNLGGSLTSQVGEGDGGGRLRTMHVGFFFKFSQTNKLQALVELNYEGRGYKQGIASNVAGDKNRIHYAALNLIGEFLPQIDRGFIVGGGISAGYLIFAQRIHNKERKESVTEEFNHDFAVKARIGYAFALSNDDSLRVLLSTFRSLTYSRSDGSTSYNYGQSLLLQYQF